MPGILEYPEKQKQEPEEPSTKLLILYAGVAVFVVGLAIFGIPLLFPIGMGLSLAVVIPTAIIGGLLMLEGMGLIAATFSDKAVKEIESHFTEVGTSSTNTSTNTSTNKISKAFEKNSNNKNDNTPAPALANQKPPIPIKNAAHGFSSGFSMFCQGISTGIKSISEFFSSTPSNKR